MSKQVRSLYVIMVELICCLENSVKLKYILKWYYSMLFAALFTAVSCGASFVKNRLTVYVLRIIMLFVCCWMFLLGAVLVICLLNMVLLLFFTLIRLQQYSLLHSLVNSENVIVKSFVESDRFFQSPLMSKWRTDLYI